MAATGHTVPHRDFDAETTGDPSCEFTLGGRRWRCRAKEDLPFAFIERMLELLGKDEETPQEQLVQVGPFFEAMLVPEQAQDFMALLHAPDSTVTLKRLGALIEYVREQVILGGRPTQPAVSSPPGRKATGRKSSAGSSSPGTRRAKSA